MPRALTKKPGRLAFAFALVAMVGSMPAAGAEAAPTQTPPTQTAPAQPPAPSPTPVVRTVPASKEELAGISARGKLLAEYDGAAWHAGDAVAPVLQKLTGPALEAMNGAFYVADKVSGKWVVSFGRLSDARDRFLVSIEAVQKDKNKDEYRVTSLAKPRAETGRLLNLARAVFACRAEFKGQSRPYNIAAVPSPKDGWYVYILPAQTVAAVFPIGGDVRYTVSPDGTTILETHPMHVAINEFKSPDQGTPAMVIRTALLDDAPEDSDVFFAITFKPATTHLILTKTFAYEVAADGQIKFVGRTEDYVKKEPLPAR